MKKLLTILEKSVLVKICLVLLIILTTIICIAPKNLDAAEKTNVICPVEKFETSRTYSSNHKGIDFYYPGINGTNVYSIQAGKVIKTTNCSINHYGVTSGCEKCGGFGTAVYVQTGDKTVIYAHLSANSICVRVNDTVSSGQKIGLVGNTGNSKGAHLHLDLQDKNKNRLNALDYFIFHTKGGEISAFNNSESLINDVYVTIKSCPVYSAPANLGQMDLIKNYGVGTIVYISKSGNNTYKNKWFYSPTASGYLYSSNVSKLNLGKTSITNVSNTSLGKATITCSLTGNNSPVKYEIKAFNNTTKGTLYFTSTTSIISLSNLKAGSYTFSVRPFVTYNDGNQSVKKIGSWSSTWCTLIK